MAPDLDGLYEEDDDYVFGQDDDYSELGPEDSASQIGRAITTEDLYLRHSRYRDAHVDHASAPSVNGTPPAVRPYSRQDIPTTPPSRRTSLRSSRLLTPTTFVPSKQDRVRYSWQSIHGDEPNRPRIHVIKIVSNTATASAGLPGGEAFGFSISPGGRRIVCYNSARLFILQTAALPVNISQEYALRRRPLAVEVVDEGGTLAVLADEHTINVYDLSHHRVRRLKTFKTDYPAFTLAVSPTGGVLAAAYEGGVEIFSLYAEALSTDRRAARAPKMDRLVFSDDGSTLLGTTTRIDISATVVVSVPVFPAAENGVPTHAELKEAWCTNILEPENINNSSHATFMRENGGTNNEHLFAWNGSEDIFGILDTQNVEYSNVDFPVTISPPLSSVGGLGAAMHSVPALDEHGETVAMVVNDRTIRLYVVPQVEDEHAKVEAHSIDHELDEEFGCPFTDIRWVYSHANLPAPKGDPSQVSGRLIIVSPGGVADPNVAEESVQDIEGGRIILFDFDRQFAGQPGQTFTLTLGKAPPQMLDEQEMDVAQEIALVRRRTNQSVKSTQRTPTIGRSASTTARRGTGTQRPLERIRDESPNGSIQRSPIERQAANASPLAKSMASNLSATSIPGSAAAPSLADLVEEVNEPIDEPYHHNAPRSTMTLQRAASAATSQRLQRVDERAQETADARENGFLPSSRYAEEPNASLSGHNQALAGSDTPKAVVKPAQLSPRRQRNESRTFARRTVEASVTRSPAIGNAAVSAPSASNGSQPDATTIAAVPAASIIRSPPTLNTATTSAPAPRPEDHEQLFQTSFMPPPMVSAAFGGGPMPRSIQRAYSNAMANVSPMSVHNPAISPRQNGREWNAISPIQGRIRAHAGSPTPGAQAPQPDTTGRGSMEEHVVSPEIGSDRTPPRRTERERQAIRERLERPDAPTGRERPSQSILAPELVEIQQEQEPEHSMQAQAQEQPRSNVPLQHSNTVATTRAHAEMQPDIDQITSEGRRRYMPAHVAAMQDAFHSSNPDAVSSSLFPMNPNHRRHSAQPAGSVAHPIINWVPPAPSSPPPSNGAASSSNGYASSSNVHASSSTAPPPPTTALPPPNRHPSPIGLGLQNAHPPSNGLLPHRSRSSTKRRPSQNGLSAPSASVLSLPLSLRRSSSTRLDVQRPRSRSSQRTGFGRRRSPKYYYHNGEWVQEEEKKCVVM